MLSKITLNYQTFVPKWFDNSYNSYVGGGVAVLIHPVVFVVLIVHGYTILIKGKFIFYDYY